MNIISSWVSPTSIAKFVIALTITAQRSLSMPPKNNRKPLGFVIFSGGIDKQRRALMG